MATAGTRLMPLCTSPSAKSSARRGGGQLTHLVTFEVLANAPPSTTTVPLLAAIIVLNSHGVARNEEAVCIEHGGTNSWW